VAKIIFQTIGNKIIENGKRESYNFHKEISFDPQGLGFSVDSPYFILHDVYDYEILGLHIRLQMDTGEVNNIIATIQLLNKTRNLILTDEILLDKPSASTEITLFKSQFYLMLPEPELVKRQEILYIKYIVYFSGI